MGSKYTEAQKKASRAYEAKQAQIQIRIKPEQKSRYEAAAQKSGKSLRAFMLEAIEEKILQENLDQAGRNLQQKPSQNQGDDNEPAC